MLEQFTLFQVFAFLFSAAGIAVVLQRIPFWDAVPSWGKQLIVVALGQIAPYVLAYLHAFITAPLGSETLANVVLGVFTAAGAFVVHYLDELLAAYVATKKAEAKQAKFDAANL